LRYQASAWVRSWGWPSPLVQAYPIKNSSRAEPAWARARIFETWSGLRNWPSKGLCPNLPFSTNRMDGSMDGVVVICAEAKGHIPVIGTSRNIQLAREELGWARLRRMHAPRILNLQKCDAHKARSLRKELVVVLQGTPRSLAVAIRARYERLGKSCRVALGSKSRIGPQGSILSGTMASSKTDVKKNLDFGQLSSPSWQTLLSFSSHIAPCARPVISSPRHCDRQHRTFWIRSRNSCVACLVTKTIFYLALEVS
jgi:hypothetical protein